ncbi:MAG: TIR domain-containing protein [Ktedonobacteraceae bacterium]|nr:TIR domain-containing protein [Ktedonobacteraceae bacterium]
MAGPRIFVSYYVDGTADHDYRFATQLITDLRAHGAEVVESVGSAGKDIAQWLNEVLPGCQWCILVQTPRAVRSLRVQMEVNTAFNLVMQQRMQGIIPVLAEPCDSDELPAMWTTLKSFDATQDYPRALTRVLGELGLLGAYDATSLALPPSNPAPSLVLASTGDSADQSSPSEAGTDDLDDRPILPGKSAMPEGEEDRPRPLNTPTPRRRSAWLVALAIVLLVGLIVASATIFAQPPSRNSVAGIATTATGGWQNILSRADVPTKNAILGLSKSGATATETAQATATSSANATAPTVPIAPIVPVAGNPTPIPGTTATASSGTSPDLYTQATSGTPTLSDPLTGPDGNKWDQSSTCAFTGGAYHASVQQNAFFSLCYAHATNFSNFAYQVKMTILSGDGGGLIFRADNAHTSLFVVTSSGFYELVQSQGSISGTSSAVNTGLNQTNVLTVIARDSSIYLYINSQYITSASDSSPTSGMIGLSAVNLSRSSEVAYSNAVVWAL